MMDTSLRWYDEVAAGMARWLLVWRGGCWYDEVGAGMTRWLLV